MKNYIFTLRNLLETEKFGEAFGHFAEPGDVLCLDGDLGAGKTTLSQAIAKGLEVPVNCYVTSPSFAIMHEYQGRIPMYHMDFYRLQDYTEVIDLGFEEYFYLSGLTIIEWSERAKEILPAKKLLLNLQIYNENMRTIECSIGDSHWLERMYKICDEAGVKLSPAEI